MRLPYRCIVTLLAVLAQVVSLGQTFTNPLAPRVADSFVAKFGDFYYLVGTPCPGDWNMNWVGIWKSRDLVHWSGPHPAYKGDERDKPMWASEIWRKGDRYYMITTCNTWNAGATMMVQEAPEPMGPYTLYCHLPKKGLDPGIFVDTDGQSYLLDSEWIAPMDSAWSHLTGDFVGTRANKEGPFMIKNGNQYLRFFARIEEGYPMEYEVSHTPLAASYKEMGKVYSGQFNPGHGCVVPSPDGTELWVVSHFQTEGWESRRLAMDRVSFDSDGLPIPVERILSEQASPSLKHIGTDISRGKFVNSSCSIPGNNPLAVIDGDIGTTWKSEKFLEIDLGGEFEIEKVSLEFPSKGKYSWTIISSCDRLNWTSGLEGYVRFIRIVDCIAPEISEVHIYPSERTIPFWSHDKRIKAPLNRDMTRGDKTSLRIVIPEDGDYDIVYLVNSAHIDGGGWSLFDRGRKIACENVAHGGVADNICSVISFGVNLSAGEHELILVQESGTAFFDSVEFVPLVTTNPRSYSTRKR